MAEENDSYISSLTNEAIGINAINPDWLDVPFYKRYEFVGASQADQAANLITSPSFTNFWSKGGNQTDNISAVRVTSATRDRNVTALSSNGKYNIDAKAQTPPQRPVPPEGIRNIDFRTYYNKEGYYLQGNQKVEIPWDMRVENAPNRWSNMNYDWHPDSPYRPATMQGTYPQLTHEEHNWWKSAMQGGEIDPKTGLKTTGYNRLLRNYSEAKGIHNSIPLALRNTAGSMVRDDRQLYSTLRYFTDGSGQGVYRGVNASTPENLAGLSSELSLYERNGRFSVPSSGKNWQSNILFTSSPSAELAIDTRNSQRVLGLGDTYRLNESAIRDANPHFKPLGGDVKEYTSPLLDIAQQEPEAIALRKANIDEARRVGKIQRDTLSGVDKNGKPWVEPMPSTRTIIYAPTNKVTQLARFVGNSFQKSAPALGAIGTLIQVTQQINALGEKDLYKREYGASDPMALRPAIDYLRKVSGLGYDDEKSQGAGEAWKQQGKLVAEPEWQLQNPISAPVYNIMHGNTQPLKGFVQGYKDMLGIK